MDQLTSLRAQYFFYTNLLISFCRSRRGKVHKIDASNQQHEYRNGAKNINGFWIASSFQFACAAKIRMEVNVSERLNKETNLISIRFKLLEGHSNLLYLRSHILFNNGR